MNTLDKLRIVLIMKGLTQHQLASQLGVSESYLTYLIKRMDSDFKNLLPNSQKSLKVQMSVSKLIDRHLKFDEKETIIQHNTNNVNK